MQIVRLLRGNMGRITQIRNLSALKHLDHELGIDVLDNDLSDACTPRTEEGSTLGPK